MPAFTSGELEIMKILWELGPLKPADIEEHFDRPIQNAAVRAVLRILMEKGHVARRKRGKAYYYRAVTPRERALKTTARRLADVFCGGSSLSLIAHLIKTENLSQEDLRELRRIAGEKPSSSRNKGAKS